MLVAAVLALIAVSRVSGRDLPGQAVAVPLPPIPAVGSCLDTGGPDPEPVTCDRLHTAEVYQSWRQGQPPADISDRCAGGGMSFTVGGPSVDWGIPRVPTTSTEVATTSPVGWEACVFIAAIDGDPTRPASFRGAQVLSFDDAQNSTVGSCYISEGPERGQQTDCSAPHSIQRVGIFYGMHGQSPASSCEDFARRVVGAAAFRGPDALHAVIGVDDSQAMFSVSVGAGETVTIEDPSSGTTIPLQTCSVVAARPLVDSVLGLGDQPLPFG